MAGSEVSAELATRIWKKREVIRSLEDVMRKELKELAELYRQKEEASSRFIHDRTDGREITIGVHGRTGREKAS